MLEAPKGWDGKPLLLLFVAGVVTAAAPKPKAVEGAGVLGGRPNIFDAAAGAGVALANGFPPVLPPTEPPNGLLEFILLPNALGAVAAAPKVDVFVEAPNKTVDGCENALVVAVEVVVAGVDANPLNGLLVGLLAPKVVVALPVSLVVVLPNAPAPPKVEPNILLDVVAVAVAGAAAAVAPKMNG